MELHRTRSAPGRLGVRFKKNLKDLYLETNGQLHTISFSQFNKPNTTQKEIFPGGIPIPTSLPFDPTQPAPKHISSWRLLHPVLSRLSLVENHDHQKEIYMAKYSHLAAEQVSQWCLSHANIITPAAVIELIEIQRRGLKSMGYEIHHVDHMLQTATVLRHAGAHPRLVALALVHDLFFVADNINHGAAIANLLKPWLTVGEDFLLRHHATFQGDLCLHFKGDHNQRECLSNSTYYEETAKFVYYYDSITNSAELRRDPPESFLWELEVLLSK